MSSDTKQTKKQSFVSGALVSSAGVFFAKFIGLLYCIPFDSMLQTPVNQEYYGSTQVLYSYLLNVCQAGFPFAIATLIARYVSKEDYKTCLLVKKLSSRLMISMGFAMMLLLIVFSKPVANSIYTGAGNATDFRFALICSAFALFFVPVLSSMRGFYQGLKEMELYSFSQVLEQLTNAAFTLGASAIAVYLFAQDRIWAVFLGVLATSVAAIVSMFHLKIHERKKVKEMKELAAQQEVDEHVKAKDILLELLHVSIPFMIIAILGYSDSIINVLFLNKGLQAHGCTRNEISLISSSINFKAQKLMSIPMVLAPGFSSAIIPHITSAITKKDYKLVRKNITQCIDIVLYVATPVALCLALFSQPLIAALFPPKDMTQVPAIASILAAFSLVAFVDTIQPILTSLLVSCGLRKKTVMIMVIQVVVKFSLSYFMLVWFSYNGLVASTLISTGICIGMSIYQFIKNYGLKLKYTFRRFIIILIACSFMSICTFVLFKLGLGYLMCDGRIMTFIKMGISGLLSVGVYFGVTYCFGLPQLLLNIDLKKLVAKIKR